MRLLAVSVLVAAMQLTAVPAVAQQLMGVVRDPAGIPFTAFPVAVSLYRNGVLQDTQLSSVIDGSYSLSPVALAANDAVVIYLDTNGGLSGAIVGVSDGSPQAGVDVFQNAVTIRNLGVGPVTTGDLATADSAADFDIPYTVSFPNVSLGSAIDLRSVAAFAPSGDVQLSGTLIVDAGGTLTVPSGRSLTLARSKPNFPPDVHPVSGALQIEAGDGVSPTFVQLGDHQQLSVSGSLQVVDGGSGFGFGSNRFVQFTRSGGSGGYSVHAQSGSSVSLQFTRFDFLYGRSDSSSELTESTVESGLTLSAGSVGVIQFQHLWFDQIADGGAGPSPRFNRYVYLLGDGDDDGITDHSFDGLQVLDVRFDNSGNLPSAANVEKRSPGNIVTFVNSSGTLGGANGDANDMDGDRGAGADTGIADILWTTTPVVPAVGAWGLAAGVAAILALALGVGRRRRVETRSA